jgi:hypothetical protein
MPQPGLKLSLGRAEEGMGPHVVLETEPGNGLHGSAPSQTKRINGVGYLDLVTVRVPATTCVEPDNPRSREAGPGVRFFILVHELIHAVGLSNDEHSADDVFAAKSVLIPNGSYLKGGAGGRGPGPASRRQRHDAAHLDRGENGRQPQGGLARRGSEVAALWGASRLNSATSG